MQKKPTKWICEEGKTTLCCYSKSFFRSGNQLDRDQRKPGKEEWQKWTHTVRFLFPGLWKSFGWSVWPGSAIFLRLGIFWESLLPYFLTQIGYSFTVTGALLSDWSENVSWVIQGSSWEGLSFSLFELHAYATSGGQANPSVSLKLFVDKERE